MRYGNDFQVLHRTARSRQRHRHSDDRNWRGRALWLAGRAISRCRAADRTGDDSLSWRQCAHAHGYGRTADRAAGQRRREHDLHAIDQCKRWQLHPDRDFQYRHRPRCRANPRAEPCCERIGVPAAAGTGAGRHGAEAVDRDSVVRDLDLAGRALRQPLPRQLRHHQFERRTGAAAGRRQRQRVRRRSIFDADLARPGQTESARSQCPGRRSVIAAAEPGGGGWAGRDAADAARRRFSAHHPITRPAGGRQPIPGRHREDRRQWRGHPPARCRSGRARRADLQSILLP